MNSSQRIPRKAAQDLGVRSLGSSVVTRERQQARAEAEKIIALAKKRAAEITCAAEQEMIRARKQGIEEGRLAGERELAKRVAQAETYRDIAADRHLPGLIDLAGRLAGRILRRELALRPESIRHICRAVIRENRPGQRLKLLVNTLDLDLLQDQGHPITSDPEIRIELHACENVEPGGCIVRSELGEVDARLSVQLEELTRLLKEDGHD